jgi:hypothetical protein
MKLTIIAPDNVFEHEVDPSMEIQDLYALISAEVSQLFIPLPLALSRPEIPCRSKLTIH